MKFRLTCLALAVVAAVAFVSADQSDAARTLMEAARKKEVVDGDLKSAIQQYQNIAEKYKSDRAVTATALVHLAECYQKLGDAESQKIYERIVREFSDQKHAVAVARARLGGTPTPTSKGDRPLLTGAAPVDTNAAISADGRLLAYVDWSHQNRDVILRDLITGVEHDVTQGLRGDAGGIAISKGNKQIAFERYTGASRLDEIRIATMEDGGVAPSRRLIAVEDATALTPSDWSPDGRWLAVSVRRKNLTGEVALVSVQDGTLRTLKSTDWQGPVRILFSPDGQYIAYSVRATDRIDESDVFIMATDASREAVAIAHPSQNIVMGWAPDGKHLLFASDRTGSFGLWAQAIATGRAQGEPVLLRADIGSSWSFGITAAGTLHVLKFTNGNYLEAAPVDLKAGKLLMAPPPIFKRFVGSGGLPAWSPDGKLLAYRVSLQGGFSHGLAIASIESGQTRELRPSLAYLSSFTWSPDGHSFTVRGTDLKGRRGLYRLDAQTGEVSTVLTQVPGEYGVPSPDRKKVYYRLSGSILELDLASGQHRTIFQSRGAGHSASIVTSPDGHYIACVEGTGTASTLLLIPAGGGEPRELLRVAAPEQLDGFRMIWTADGQSLIVPKQRDSGATGPKNELWLVPTTGAPPHRLDIDVDNWLIGLGHFDISPDGRQIAFVAGSGKMFAEIWALENFLPALKASR